MRKILFALGTIGFLFSSQAQELPKPSPAATVTQRVGLTDIEVNYSRPSVKERTIFGGLVPYNEVWRTGANASTKIMFSTDVKINGADLKAGTYSFYVIPTEGEWTVIFNNNLNLWGSGGYSETEDALRTMVKPMAGQFMESMQFSFDNLQENNAMLKLSWAESVMAIKIEVDTESQKEKNVEKALNDAGKTYRNSASFYADKGNYERALELADLAVKVDPSNWYTNWVKAEIMAQSGDIKGAKKQAKTALELGDIYYKEIGRDFTYRAGIEKDIESWSAKK